MSHPNLSAEVVLSFGDGEHLFAIKGKQLETLEKLCDASISEISHRVLSMVPKYADLYNVILLGLEGGGMPPVEAKQFMDRYFVGRPIAAENDPHSPIKTAAKIMEAVWFGVEDIETEKSDTGSGDKKRMNFAAYRAALVRSGVSPLEIHRMSLYEIASMNAALRKIDKTHMPKVSDDEWAQAEAMLAAATVNDTSVQLH